ncbi:hypothetical protein HMPREF9099_00127 [Lachnospiraceae bacterium oral taxon 082 str. F0431]|nr:hypothetical protein HMPREF9099_00127 [Lachnospiraceae bacterium oral taxon 082 str. F0431]
MSIYKSYTKNIIKQSLLSYIQVNIKLKSILMYIVTSISV